MEEEFIFPIVLLESEKGWETFIETKALNELKTAQEPIDLIKKRS